MNLKSQHSSSQISNNENEISVKYAGSTEFITVPSFLLKTYEIVSDPAYSDIVCWNKAGDAFVITKTNDFWEKILPLYFKHKNLSSFVRQLNMYGFHKTKYKNNEQCFTHKFFRKDNKKLLLEMKRKTKDKIKEKSIEKKNSTADSITKNAAELKISSEIKAKFKEQDKRINQLLKANKDFKNSVLALYTEMEKLKEKEKNLEKILISAICVSQKGNSIQIKNDANIEKSSDCTFHFDNQGLMNLFKEFIDNLHQNYQNSSSNNLKFGQGSWFNFSGNNYMPFATR